MSTRDTRRRRALLLALSWVASTGITGRLSATPPPLDDRPLPPAVAGHTLPQAGYLRTAKLLFLRRRAADRNPHLNAAFGTAPVLSGRRSALVIALAYQNRAAPKVKVGNATQILTPDILAARLFGQGDDQLSLARYYRDVSDGRLTVEGRVAGWYALPQKDTFYENNLDLDHNGTIEEHERMNGWGPPFAKLLDSGLTLADADVDFGDFDNDGPDGLPNSGDDDGKVDLVFFVHPEVGAECGKDARDNVWSHFSTYMDATNSSSPFATKDPQRDASGQVRLDGQGKPLSIFVADYTIQPALSCKSAAAGSPSLPVEIGVFVHEYGHALGLPDLYDRTVPRTGSIGSWCLMASGSYGGGMAFNPARPTSLSAWGRYFLGWSQQRTIGVGGPVALGPSQEHGEMLRLLVPQTSEREYFLVEYRGGTWTDPTGVKAAWDAELPGPGLAIWHVDENVGSGSPRWPFASPGQGQNDAASELVSGATPAKFASQHALVALIQADGKYELMSSGNADAADLFGPQQAFGDDATLRRGSRGYQGQATGIAIKDIDLGSRTMTVDFGGAPTPVISMVPQPPAVAGLQAVAPLTPEQRATLSDKLGQARIEASTQSIKMTTGERQWLRTLDVDRVAVTVDRSDVPWLRRLSMQARTIDVPPGAAASGDLPPELAQAWTSAVGGNSTTMRVTLASGRGGLERIEGLSLPSPGPPAEDAASRLTQELGALVAPGADLRQIPGTTTFQQVVPLGGRELPVLDAGVQLGYDDHGVLRSVVSSTRTAIAVVAFDATMTPAAATAMVMEQLNLPAGAAVTLGEPWEVVFVGAEDQARAAYVIDVASGEGHEAIHVVVDQATRTILAID